MAEVMTSGTVKQYVPKEGVFDLTKRVSLKATDKHPFLPEGAPIECGTVVAEKFKLNGWAK